MGCYQSSQNNGNKDQSTNDVTEAQAINFALDLEHSIESNDSKRVDELVDMEFISNLAFRDLIFPDRVKQIYLEAASKQSMLATVIEQVRNYGAYRFLKLKKVGNVNHPIFRLVDQNGALAYHEFKLTLNTDGLPIASDFQTSVTGKWMQSDLVNNVISQLQIRGETSELSDAGKLFLAHSSTFNKMLQAVRTGEALEEALEDFRKIPEELQSDRRYLILAMNIASRISQEELEIELDRFNKYISDQSFKDLILLDLVIRQKKTEDALKIIQRIDSWIGGDVFLDFARANAFLASDRLDEAYAASERVRIAMPDIYAIYRTCIIVAARRYEYHQVTRLLREIEVKFDKPIDLDRLLVDKELAEYVRSSSFRELQEFVEPKLSK